MPICIFMHAPSTVLPMEHHVLNRSVVNPVFYERSYGYDVEVSYSCVLVLYGKTETTICAAVVIERTYEQPINMCLLTCCIGYKQVVGSIERTVGYSRRICPDSAEDDSRTNRCSGYSYC